MLNEKQTPPPIPGEVARVADAAGHVYALAPDAGGPPVQWWAWEPYPWASDRFRWAQADRDEAATAWRLLAEARGAELDAAEAIVHALCDERRAFRHEWRRLDREADALADNANAAEDQRDRYARALRLVATRRRTEARAADAREGELAMALVCACIDGEGAEVEADVWQEAWTKAHAELDAAIARAEQAEAGRELAWKHAGAMESKAREQEALANAAHAEVGRLESEAEAAACRAEAAALRGVVEAAALALEDAAPLVASLEARYAWECCTAAASRCRAALDAGAEKGGDRG